MVAQAQGICKALGNEQQGAIAPPFQEGIGGDGGAHFDQGDGFPWDRVMAPQPHQVPDPLEGSIGVVVGIVRQQFMGHEGTIGALGHDIGEGAAAIDPKLPLGFLGWGGGLGHGLAGKSGVTVSKSRSCGASLPFYPEIPLASSVTIGNMLDLRDKLKLS